MTKNNPVSYHDSGCPKHSPCVSCPYPITECPEWEPQFAKEIRNRTIRDLLRTLPLSGVATRMNMDVRTIQKLILEEADEETKNAYGGEDNGEPEGC